MEPDRNQVAMRGSQRQPHNVGKRRQSSRGGKAIAQSGRAQPLTPKVEGSNPSVPAKRKRAPAGTFDRKAYQRDYMRKRRTVEKANREKGILT